MVFVSYTIKSASTAMGKRREKHALFIALRSQFSSMNSIFTMASQSVFLPLRSCLNSRGKSPKWKNLVRTSGPGGILAKVADTTKDLLGTPPEPVPCLQKVIPPSAVQMA